MGRDDQPGAEELDESDEGESHAADEPTAVWDENALKAAGLGDLWKKKDVEPKAAPAATAPSAKTADPSIVIEENLGAQPSVVLAKPVPQASKPAGLGWGATIGIALALGAIAYGIIRLLKG